MKTRKGQVAIYLVMVLVALTILAVMNVDLFLSVRSKFRAQNAGDAAALAVARHQGHLLNEIGRLNIEHLYAAVKEDSDSIVAIESRQRRLALLGPLEAVALSDEAAAKNGAPVCSKRSDFLHDHAKYVREVYACGSNEADDPFPESWPGAWEEYANEIDRVAGDGLAAGADNIDFYNSAGGHLLVTKRFYDAIQGRDWCWFFFNCNSTLEGYGSYHDWSPLPKKEAGSFDNSEIYPLYVEFRRGSIFEWFSAKEITDILRNADYKVSEKEVGQASFLKDPKACWVFFDDFMWRTWDEMKDFPLVGNVKEEFDYRGAAAICRVSDSANVWSAAAKPLGAISRDKPLFVLPVFDAVRLVPLDAVGGNDLATADIEWIRHVREHLDYYLEHGPAHFTDCGYCNILKHWEKRSFRQEGMTWLKFNSGSCYRPTGGSYSGSGGTAHGH